MGLFSKAFATKKLQPRKLRTGTQVAMVDVDPAFVDYARTHAAKTPKVGHIMQVYLQANRSDIVVLYDNKVVGKMRPDMVRNYIDDINTLSGMGQIGWTEAFIKWEGSKAPHALALNWGRGAQEGGIL